MAPIENLEIRKEKTPSLVAYGQISIAFTAFTVFDVVTIKNGLGLSLIERKLDDPFVKDYDLDGANTPALWSERFDLRSWAFLFAYDKGKHIGGAAVAWNTPEVNLLQGRSDIALLWDIRVSPELRGFGVGRKLVATAKDWAKSVGCAALTVETQNINVPACRFYAMQGFELFSIDPLAYPDYQMKFNCSWRLKIGDEPAHGIHSRGRGK